MSFRYVAVAALAFAAAGTMSAITIAPQNYTYDLTLPTIANGVEVDSTTFDFQFSWGPGPLKFNAADNTSCPLGCPVDGTTPGTPAPDYSYSGMFFTASTAESCGAVLPNGCAEVVISFSDSLSDDITFTLIEPDAFWATGGPSTFGQGDGTGGIGASWVQSLVGTAASDDPPCTSCSVFTTLSTPSAAPEPGTWLMLVGGFAVLGVRKFRKS